MSEEDSELERLKAKRLAEMQKNLVSRKTSDTPPEQNQKPSESPRDILVKVLGFRGLEVLEKAEAQFPNETKIIVDKLSELIKSGEINETIDGGKLMTLFRSVGLHVRLETKINIEQDGKFVSLSDKLNQSSKDDE